jgi:hypothetical protein
MEQHGTQDGKNVQVFHNDVMFDLSCGCAVRVRECGEAIRVTGRRAFEIGHKNCAQRVLFFLRFFPVF